MKKSSFKPDEISFSPTTMCNLNCAHCNTKKNRSMLSIKLASGFIKKCAKEGILKLGFTGGEPFLAPKFLYAITKKAVKHNMNFERIVTNGVWFRSKASLISILKNLFSAGYDGEISISIDAFHNQDIKKVSFFIQNTVKIWNRKNMVTIFSIKGAKEEKTHKLLLKLSRLLNAHLSNHFRTGDNIKSRSLFIKIYYNDLSAIGKASLIKNPWDGKWFKDDFCKGPGNVFFVQPDGKVKPCCGFANDSDLLTIGSIKKDSPKKLILNAKKNFFARMVFEKGFHPIRKKLEKSGIKFPGKTSNHCFFCHYLINNIPGPIPKKHLS